MTLPLSSSPVHLDLGTINEVQAVVLRELRNQVCTWEQKAVDASKYGDFRSAQQYSEWAFAADILVSAASRACTALFLDTCESLPVVADTRTVELPDLNRSSEDRFLDTLSVEVASAQPCPIQS
jgi:hypothetical protein